MKILFVTDPYPSKTYPNNGVFVYGFVQELVRQGHEVTVISPKKITFYSIFTKGISYGTESAKVFQPCILTASAKKIGSFNTYSVTHIQKERSVRRILKKNQIDFDIVFCHFISSAMYAVEALKGKNKPIFVAVGENRNMEVAKNWYKVDDYFSRINKVSGFIAVSDIIRGNLINRLKVDSPKIIVEPNGTDLRLFIPGNKQEMRMQYGFSENAFIVVFVGRFINNKGPIRVLDAVKDIENTKMVFIGEGRQTLEHPNILFRKKVPRAQMPGLLSCADVFVLPTLHEGSNNAIIEAMACGLPIVSSDIPEIRVQCTSEFAILVDPMDVEAIRNAVLEIKNNPVRTARMSEKAVAHSRNFDLAKRAQKIIGFIENMISTQR